MTDRFQNIYLNNAAEYDELVSREDYEGNLLKALEAIRPLAGLDVVELGAGTGRLTRLLAPFAGSIRAYDASQAMLDIAADRLTTMSTNSPIAPWTLAVADNRSLPADSTSADLSIAGWSFGHTVDWSPEDWQTPIGAMVDEMIRVLRPGGTAVILETLGTGVENPAPPTPELAAYYTWLEQARGFQAVWTRTDYQFESVGEAEQLVRFFFGDALADFVVQEKLLVLPECTGLWWTHVS
jgi:ubiquinone/menaquinone biosynthesis C-methylase UbiE